MFKKFLIVGLGNPGLKYINSRHNLGFKVIDEILNNYSYCIISKKLGVCYKIIFNKKLFFLLKPNTYINLSGKSIIYYINKYKFKIKNILIITDDINRIFGIIKIKPKGGSGGHNGLKDIENKLKTNLYARLYFGTGKKKIIFDKKKYVLSDWDKNENIILHDIIKKAANVVISFGINGLNKTMNIFNSKDINLK